MLKIRRPLGRLIFNMGIAIPGKTVFLIETAPRRLTGTYSFLQYTKNGQMIVFYLSYQYEHEGIDNIDWLTMLVSIHMTMQYIVVINLYHMISGPACHVLYATFAVLRYIRGAVCRFHIGVTLLSLNYWFDQYNHMRICDRRLLLINSSPPSATYMCQWNGSVLVQIMACRFFGTKPLSEPTLTYCQLDA